MTALLLVLACSTVLLLLLNAAETTAICKKRPTVVQSSPKTRNRHGIRHECSGKSLDDCSEHRLKKRASNSFAGFYAPPTGLQ